MPRTMLMRAGQQGAGISVTLAGRAAFDAVVAAADPRHAFLSHAWYAADAGERLDALVATRADGSPLAAIPRVRRRIGPASMSEIAGCYWPFRSLPVVADAAPEELAVLLRSKAARQFLGPVWRLGPIFSDDPALARLREAAAGAGWRVLTRILGHCFEFDFATLRADGPWPRTSSQASNRRRERKLAALGEISYRFISGRDWTPADRDAMAKIERESWLAGIGEQAAPKFDDPARRGVWERAAEDPAIAGMMFCSLMFVGGEPAAFAFGMEAGGVRHCIANSYSQRFGQHGPGKLLLYKDFEMAADRGVAKLNWGSGDLGYKSEMGATEGAEILDLLFVRSKMLATGLKRIWR
jgi:CelD/BcsL family acetyltransferase involved in cellulose biosynthesis